MESVYKRVAVKVGSNVLTRSDGTLDVTRMSALVDQIASLRRAGIEVILISSGAVASGRSELRLDSSKYKKMDSVEQRQLFSAVGQAKLINRYYELFREYGIPVGQVLTMKENFSTRRHYLNQRSCMMVMLDNGVLPIVNENDTVSVTELMFTDNDELSGLIATMMDVQALVILSNVDGVYNGVPGTPGVSVIPEVEPDRDLSEYITAAKSGFGRGGMITKCNIARKVADEGIEVIIANGKSEGVLVKLLTQTADVLCTRFLPKKSSISSVKKWIAHSGGFVKGEIRLNSKAVERVCGSEAVSILPVGVVAVGGDFEKDDLVRVLSHDGTLLGIGRAAYGSSDAREFMGRHDCKPIVHYDYLYLE
ncbi:MAG: glutamate 5-kinase [Bacteroidaceae bacterium]|nr:glutamate 5-kinase [Bacteroidaceae bacterium]